MPVLPREETVAYVERLRAEGKRIVFTNGVFDLMHPGHLRCLQYARQLGDALVVGVNSDRSVRAIKGESRPVVTEDERAELLAALACVDLVVVFDEETPRALLSLLRPDVLVKGGDWPEHAIVGRDIVEALGGRVVRAPLQGGYSTTGIIDKIRQALIPDPKSLIPDPKSLIPDP